MNGTHGRGGGGGGLGMRVVRRRRRRGLLSRRYRSIGRPGMKKARKRGGQRRGSGNARRKMTGRGPALMALRGLDLGALVLGLDVLALGLDPALDLALALALALDGLALGVRVGLEVGAEKSAASAGIAP